VKRSLLAGGAAVLALSLALPGAAGAARTFSAPTYSSPIAMSAGGGLVWVVNPDADSVSVIGTASNRVIKTIKVGDEPQGVALDPADRYAYVANAADSTVSVIRISSADPSRFRAKVDRRVGRRGELTTGAEPWNIVASPNGRRIFVANSGQDTITVIDATRRKVRRRTILPRIIGHVDLRDSRCNDPDRRRHFQPRGLAVTRDSRKLYVTGFLAFVKPGGRQGDDSGEEGVVCRLDVNTKSRRLRSYRPAARITLESRNTGFDIDSDPETIGPDPTFAFPNQMQSIVIRGDRAYLPNVAASPDAPLRRNGNTHSFVNQVAGVGGRTPSDAGAINLNVGALELVPGAQTLFFANAWAIGFNSETGPGTAYVVLAGSDVLVKLNVAADGTLSFTVDETTTEYIDLNDATNPATIGAGAGKNPQGIVVTRDGTRAYVNNYVSRNVSVVDLTTDSVIDVIRTAPLPRPGTRDEVVLVGAEMFFSSRGVFDRPPGATDLTATKDRLSSQGFGSCAGCHFKGLSDGVVWESNTGPRKSVPLNATFNPNDPEDQRVLGYSAIFDEVEDFELYIRGRSGHGPGDLATLEGTRITGACDTPPPDVSSLDPAHGLLMGDSGNPDRAPCEIVPFAKPNANRTQFTVTLPGSGTAVPALTALKQWVRFGIRTPNAPLARSRVRGGVKPAMVSAGRRLFSRAGCTSCHVGGKWTNATKGFASPPDPAKIFTETSPAPVFGSPVDIGYLNRFLRDVGSFNLGVPGEGNALAGNIGAEEKAGALLEGPFVQARADALGRDYNGDGSGNGYAVPSLLGIGSAPPYFHNGACETLACVLRSVEHRTAGRGIRDRLKRPKDRARLVAFLESIDETTPAQRRTGRPRR
jgi:YVTN family beta-propeller protein